MIKGEDLGVMYRPPFNPKFLEKQRLMRLKAIEAQNESKKAQEVIRASMKKGEKIARRICNAMNVSLDEVRGPRRFKHLVLVRFAICYWIRRRTNYSWPQVAQVICRKDHTTALHGANEYIKMRAKMGRKLPQLNA